MVNSEQNVTVWRLNPERIQLLKTKRLDPSEGELLAFLDRLRESKIHFSLASHREGAIMIQITVPGERWEVEFLGDGSVEVERFRSDGQISDQSALETLFEQFAETGTSSKEA